jgi:glycosyltransferase involved in cell wall biosynthesis
MRILYVSSKKGWGGVVSWMERTALGLEARGHKVWIISHPLSRFTMSASRGVRIIPKRLGMDYNPVMILYLVSLIKRNHIDIVVTNIQKEVTVGGGAAKLAGILSIRRIGNENDINPRFRWRQDHLVDHTIAPSKSVLDKVEHKWDKLDRARYTVLYNGCNPAVYSRDEILSQRRAWGLADEDLIIGYTGQLAPVKGLDCLMEAFNALAVSHPDLRLVLSGEGRAKSDLESLAGRLGMGDRIVLAGFSNDPLRAAASYDIAVLNSSQEGFPNTLVEYMAAGTAAISANIGGVAEILKDGENGLLIDAGRTDQLINALAMLLKDTDLRLRLGQAAMKTVEKGFSEDLMVDRLERFFQERLSGRRR